MAANQLPDHSQLLIAVDHDLEVRIKQAADARDLSVSDYVTAILRQAVEAEDEEGEAGRQQRWSQLSAGAFARDWESDEDSVYDQLPSR